MTELETFIKSKINIKHDELELIVSNFKEVKVAKDKFVLKKGHIATDYFFIASGGLRISFENKGKEMTGWVALENHFVTDLFSVQNEITSKFNIQAIEDTILFSIKHKKMEELYCKFPFWQEFGRKIWESAFLGILEGVLCFQSMSAEERYLSTMKNSDLLQRIPLKDLASYLGITPSSLSRLRKNVK